MTKNTKEEMVTMFEDIFSESVNEAKFDNLCDFWGNDLVNTALNYLLVNGLKPPKPGQTPNPYGLLFSLCGRFN